MLCVTAGGKGDSLGSASLTPWSAQKVITHAGDAVGVVVACCAQSVIAMASSVPSAPGGLARLSSRAPAAAAQSVHEVHDRVSCDRGS
eukprot:7301384-Prymnesium_polylepis.1